MKTCKTALGYLPTLAMAVVAVPVTTMVVATPAAAQSTYCPSTTSTSCLQAKQNVNSRNYQIGFDNPIACDDEIQSAANLWRNAGSRFSTQQDAEYWYGKRVPGTNKYQVTFQPGADFYNSGALAETPYGNSVAGYNIDGKTIPVVDDADIMVNSDKWAAGSFDCGSAAPTSNEYDLGRIVAHEFGHLTGQAHVSAPACATYTYGQKGVAIGALCTTEVSALRRLYGTP